MTIVAHAEPAGGREIVHHELGERLQRARDISALRGSLQTAGPLPVYVIDAEKVADSKRLSRARMVGWRYPIIGGPSPGLAHLIGEAQNLKFVGISHGQIPARLLDAAVLAEKKLGSLKEKYEPRILEIPSLRLCALWFHGARGRDNFVVLVDGQEPSTAPLRIEPSIEARTSAALAALRRRTIARVPPVVERPAAIGRRDMTLLFVALTISMAVVGLGTIWIDWLSSSPLRAWLIEVVLLTGLFAALGISVKKCWCGMLVDGRNKVSLSRLQIVLWTILFVAAFFVIYVWNIGHAPMDAATNSIDLAKALNVVVPNTVWLLMGMAGLSAAATPAILSAKSPPDPSAAPPPRLGDPTKFLDGVVVKRKAGQKPEWSDIVLGDEAGNADSIDISKVQLLLLSLVAIVAYAYAIGRTMAAAYGVAITALPTMNGGFLALIAASHGTYLIYKGVSHAN
jgi:hypothetical protein